MRVDQSVGACAQTHTYDETARACLQTQAHATQDGSRACMKLRSQLFLDLIFGFIV
jgi:hypothetical protein